MTAHEPERRLRHDDVSPPAFLDAECLRQWQEMRNTLIRQEHKALNRRFDGSPITDFGSLG